MVDEYGEISKWSSAEEQSDERHERSEYNGAPRVVIYKKLDSLKFNHIGRDIEVVITGLTRNQFVRKHTRVRIPLSPPKTKSILKEGAFLLLNIKKGFERRE